MNRYNLLKNLLRNLNDYSLQNVATIQYSTPNYLDYWLYFNTTDDYIAGQLIEIYTDERDVRYTYHDIGYNISNEMFYYFMDDLILYLIEEHSNKNITFPLDISEQIRIRYQTETINKICNLNDNIIKIKDL